MRCNSCWRELEGRAVSTTCGHLLCTEDANKILNNDAACPICDQVLSKSLMKPVEINPNDEWINMAMAGISPQILMKSAYRSVMFFIGQRELEMQYKMNRMVAQCRQKCESMQEKFTEKLEQLHTAYQKMAKRCQMMEQEIESLSKDKQELQENFSEKARQKRKLDEMYDQLRSECESNKRSAIQPANNFFSRNDPDLFSNPAATMMDNRDPIRKDWTVVTPSTPGPREDIWAARQNSSNSGPFEISGGSPAKQAGMPDFGGSNVTLHEFSLHIADSGHMNSLPAIGHNYEELMKPTTTDNETQFVEVSDSSVAKIHFPNINATDHFIGIVKSKPEKYTAYGEIFEKDTIFEIMEYNKFPLVTILTELNSTRVYSSPVKLQVDTTN